MEAPERIMMIHEVQNFGSTPVVLYFIITAIYGGK